MPRDEILLNAKMFILRLKAHFSTFRGGGFLSNHCSTAWPLLLLRGIISFDMLQCESVYEMMHVRDSTLKEGERIIKWLVFLRELLVERT